MGFDGIQIDTKPTGKKNKLGERGCDHCPLNEVSGVQKIMGRIDGKDILIVAQSPGPEENDAGKELVGKSGQWLWEELKQVGIRRRDCDIQNTVRCYPCDASEGSYKTFLKMRNPTAVEIHCCSIHTEKMMEQSKAKHILILGQIAQKAFLGVRSVPQQKIFWNEKLKAKIYLADHPAFFIRGYGAGGRLDAFRSTLRELAAGWKNEEAPTKDNYSYLRKQSYQLVRTAAQAVQAGRIIKKYAAKRRIAVDIEYDEIDGKTEIFAIGFCPKPGMSFVFIAHHPKLPQQSAEDIKYVTGWAKVLLENKDIRKVFHYGCSDVSELAAKGVVVQGYEWDTNYSEYLWYPDAKKYGLAAIAERRFQEFSGYKSIVLEELFAAIDSDVKVPSAVMKATPEGKVKWLAKNKQYRLSRLSLDTLRLYNGADCDLTKRIEVDTKKNVPLPLVRLYIDLSFILRDMEPNGPMFDEWQNRRVARLYVRLGQKALARVRKMVGNQEFNPNSPPQVYDAIYNKFKLKYPMSKGKPNTQKKTLMMMSRKHKFPAVLIACRRVGKAYSTYIESYAECAKQFNGRLKTTFWATGTTTGRLSSSGGDDGGVNLQNIIKDAQLQNQLVADMRWRVAFNAIAKIVRKYKKRTVIEGMIETWLRANMPDLKTFLILDYGQVEVRVGAMLAYLLTGLHNLMDACSESDIHSVVGSAMTGWSVDKIKNDNKTRTLTKNIHFGIMFTLSKKNMFEFIKAMDPDFDGTEEQVGAAYDKYFENYPEMRQFIDSQQEFARENGYVETLFGLHRELNITGFHNDEEEEDFVDESGERKTSWTGQAVSTPVQGTAHQLLECGMVNLRRKPKEYAKLHTPVMDVHDALYFNVNVLELPECYRLARVLMEKESIKTAEQDFGIDWKVPIVTDAEAGIRLGGKIKLKEGFTVGGFLLSWFLKTKKQIEELNAQLAEVGE